MSFQPWLRSFTMPQVRKPPPKRAPHFLREWRLHRELNQEQASERLEIERSTLSRIETGKVPYNQDLLERAALAYGCDPADLLNVDPRAWNELRLVYDQLRLAPREMQERALAIVTALLKTG